MISLCRARRWSIWLSTGTRQVLDGRNRGQKRCFFLGDSVPNINIRNRLRFFLCVCFADWTLDPSLLHAYVAMSLNRPLRTAFKALVRMRRSNGLVTENELTMRGSFLQTFANGFATWVLQNIKSSYAAKRQVMYHTFVAKFYGLSRTGISLLADYDLLSPLTSMDRSWRDLLSDYKDNTRYNDHGDSILLGQSDLDA